MNNENNFDSEKQEFGILISTISLIVRIQSRNFTHIDNLVYFCKRAILTILTLNSSSILRQLTTSIPVIHLTYSR